MLLENADDWMNDLLKLIWWTVMIVYLSMMIYVEYVPCA